MNLRFLMLAGAAAASLGLGGHAAQAGPCPTLSNDPSRLAGHCNIIVTLNADGSTTTVKDAGVNYDGNDDALIGVVNNSANPIGAGLVSGLPVAGNDIFGFDGDGIDVYIPITNNALDGSGYGGPNAYFTGINAALSAGTVNFITPIAAGGGTGYFSLEAAIDPIIPIQFIPLPPPPPPPPPCPNPVSCPEPVSIALFGSGLLGLGFVKRRQS